MCEKCSSLKVNIISFGYKFGLIDNPNLLVDVRCLENPYYVDELRELNGLNKKVSDFVMQFDSSKILAENIITLIKTSLRLHLKKGFDVFTVAIGCTGGKHRSVTIAELIFKELIDCGYNVHINHRDIIK